MTLPPPARGVSRWSPPTRRAGPPGAARRKGWDPTFRRPPRRDRSREEKRMGEGNAKAISFDNFWSFAATAGRRERHQDQAIKYLSLPPYLSPPPGRTGPHLTHLHPPLPSSDFGIIGPPVFPGPLTPPPPRSSLHALRFPAGDVWRGKWLLSPPRRRPSSPGPLGWRRGRAASPRASAGASPRGPSPSPFRRARGRSHSHLIFNRLLISEISSLNRAPSLCRPCVRAFRMRPTLCRPTRCCCPASA